MPKVRALAYETWQAAVQKLEVSPDAARARRAEVVAFWDWAILELLVQTGLRREEAHHLRAVGTFCCTSSPQSLTVVA
jgi:hypothetical protein